MVLKHELPLPRLIGSRPAVRALARELDDVRGHEVVLNARGLRSASPSSADEFVKVLLVDGGASSLRVVGAGPDFIEDVEKAASDHHVSSRLVTPSLK
jgi:hypothetical protein